MKEGQVNVWLSLLSNEFEFSRVRFRFLGRSFIEGLGHSTLDLYLWRQWWGAEMYGVCAY